MFYRYEELDSLRGLAAVSVLFGHIYLIFNKTFLSGLLFEFGPLRFMVAGSEAVILFFVLSGFVLSLPFYSNKYFSYGSYLTKRICRIYFPYLTSVLLAYLLREIFYTGNVEGLTNWFNVNWSKSLDASSITDHILLIGIFASNINNVVWSLVHEMRISLIFPIIVYILVRLSWKKGIAFGLILSVISVVYSNLSDNALFIGTELYATIHYSAIFVIGALIAKYRETIKSKLLIISKRRKNVLFFIGIFFYLYAHPSFILNIFVDNFNPFYRTVIDSWFTSLGAGILIVLAISHSQFSRLLRNRFVNYLGRISYSLYLSHIAVLFSCVHLLNGIVSLWAISLISVLVTFIVSVLMYHLIEKQSIKLGKICTRSTDNRERNLINTAWNQRV